VVASEQELHSVRFSLGLKKTLRLILSWLHDKSAFQFPLLGIFPCILMLPQALTTVTFKTFNSRYWDFASASAPDFGLFSLCAIAGLSACAAHRLLRECSLIYKDNRNSRFRERGLRDPKTSSPVPANVGKLCESRKHRRYPVPFAFFYPSSRT
jgi:hypothetical protein